MLKPKIGLTYFTRFISCKAYALEHKRTKASKIQKCLYNWFYYNCKLPQGSYNLYNFLGFHLMAKFLFLKKGIQLIPNEFFLRLMN